jgi:hypothetical protein
MVEVEVEVVVVVVGVGVSAVTVDSRSGSGGGGGVAVVMTVTETQCDGMQSDGMRCTLQACWNQETAAAAMSSLGGTHSLMMSMVAMARPAPLTRHPMLPSIPT